MKRQFIHPPTPEPLILLENYLLEWNCPLYSLNKKNIAIQKTHFHYTAQKKPSKKQIDWMITIKKKISLFIALDAEFSTDYACVCLEN